MANRFTNGRPKMLPQQQVYSISRSIKEILLNATLAWYMLWSGVTTSQGGVLSKWHNGSSWVLAQRLPSTYLKPCCKEIWVSLIIRVLPSETTSHRTWPIFLLFCHSMLIAACVMNLVWLKFITPSAKFANLCLQHVCHEARVLRGLFAAAETCL